jgi:hypothetical protein
MMLVWQKLHESLWRMKDMHFWEICAAWPGVLSSQYVKAFSAFV